jgi:alkanesulfonate monooxygenase SsuD/methylene tetrahydromethanopterin reductase-like flavin-dependent oxidoreductase (luciferase family)
MIPALEGERNMAQDAPAGDGVAPNHARPLKVGLHLPEIERIAPWRDLAEMSLLAEEVGFDSIWVPDHLIYKNPGEEITGPWECWSVLCAVAAITKRVEIGPLVLCTSFREPGLVAKMADTVDEISNGRLILGLGAGWNRPEYDAFGYPFEERVGRFFESFTIIRTLLRTGAIDFAGKYYTLRECELRPRGPRSEGPPLMIGARGEQMLRATLPYVDSWNGWHAWGGNTVEGYRPWQELVTQACVAVGRNPEEVERTMAVLVHMPGNDGKHDVRSTPIEGSNEQIAQTLRDLAAMGVTHVQVVLSPNTLAAVEAFAPVLEMLRRS